jgi:hypothetical protein
MNTNKLARSTLVFLLALLGLGALGGGGMLVLSPDGSWIGLPLSVLAHSPFTSFLLPVLILFFVLWIWPVYTAFALVYKRANALADKLNIYSDMYWAFGFSLYIAFALIIWIQVQMVMVQSVSWLHTLYMFWAVAILVVALLPASRAYFKK